MEKVTACWRHFAAWINGDLPEAAPAPDAPAKKEDPLRRSASHLVRRVQHSQTLVGRAVFAVSCVGVCAVFCLVMLYTVAQLPLFGLETDPAENEVSQRYIEQGVEEVGATNLVTNMILVYRGFDTYGESCVLFLAATCVIILLRRDAHNHSEWDDQIQQEDMQIEKEESSIILQEVVKILMPLILMFGLYVLFNGHLSPGGGFAGGAILGGSMILFDNAFGAKAVSRFFGEKLYLVIKIGALLLYAALICYTIFVGANGLFNFIPKGTPGSIFSGGITMPINVAVGLEVACTMYAFYAFFSKGDL
jgi:multicomponent Na+:H+ antiporter subunit B